MTSQIGDKRIRSSAPGACLAKIAVRAMGWIEMPGYKLDPSGTTRACDLCRNLSMINDNKGNGLSPAADAAPGAKSSRLYGIIFVSIFESALSKPEDV
jgi:hypothetical protein